MSHRRILVFSLAYYPVEGGAEIAVREIIKRMRDIHFDIVTMRFDESHPEEEHGENYTIYRIKSYKNTFPFRAAHFASALREKHPYDTAWAIMANWAGLAALFYKFWHPGERYILTLQEGDPLPYIMRKARIIWPLFKAIFVWADKVQAISNFLADWAWDMGHRGRVEVVPNGVNFEAFQGFRRKPFNKDGVVIVTASRLVVKNAVKDIIESLTFLPHGFSLDILGSGPLEASLKKLTEKLGLEDRVRFLGKVSYEEIPNYFANADVFVRPSLSEGFGNSFIEAMAAGLPVVATPVGGIPDFLKDPSNSSGQAATGLFCEVKNPQSIAKQIERIVNDRELRVNMTARAKAMVKERYGWDLVARRMKEEVFDPLLADR